MTELLTAAQMRAIEQAAIDSGEVTGLDLMERAGRGVVEAVFEEWPELAKTSHRAVVLCGPGNNGGDGFVVARLLKEWGWEVEVFLYGDPDKLPPDARVNYERWGEMGDIRKLDPTVFQNCSTPDLVFDSLFGTGLKRALPERVAKTVDTRSRFLHPNYYRTRYVGVDCPTGLDCDSGAASVFMSAAKPKEEPEAEPVNFSNLTVTFHSPKIGHYLLDGPSVCSKLRVIDIGLRGDAMERTIACAQEADLERVRLLEPRFCWRPLKTPGFPHPMLEKSARGHKYTEGHALILSGGPGKTGAARLAARGALRIGAGLVTLGVPDAAQMEVATQITAIMLRRAGDADELATVLDDDRLNAVCVGPGLGLDARAAGIVAKVLEQSRPDHAKDRFAVLDADALTLASQDAALFAALHENCVITPHAGEFARLFPDIAEKLNATPTKGPAYSKVDATREAAKRAGCVVLFKGPDTVIAAPDGRCSINSSHYDRAAPWLATAGSGDVLSGFITGLLARGFAPMQAAETAAWLHVECALSFGPGLIAEDLPEELPAVFRALGV